MGFGSCQYRAGSNGRRCWLQEPAPSAEAAGGEGSAALAWPSALPVPDTDSGPGSSAGPRLLGVEPGTSLQAPPEIAEVNFVVNVNFRSCGRALKQADTTLSLCILIPLLSN